MRKPDKIPALVDRVFNTKKDDVLWEFPVGVLSRQEPRREFYPETRYTLLN